MYIYNTCTCTYIVYMYLQVHVHIHVLIQYIVLCVFICDVVVLISETGVQIYLAYVSALKGQRSFLRSLPAESSLSPHLSEHWYHSQSSCCVASSSISWYDLKMTETSEHRNLFNEFCEKYTVDSTNLINTKFISKEQGDVVIQLLKDKPTAAGEENQLKLWIRKRGFALTSYPHLGLRDVLCIPVKEEVRNVLICFLCLSLSVCLSVSSLCLSLFLSVSLCLSLQFSLSLLVLSLSVCLSTCVCV